MTFLKLNRFSSYSRLDYQRFFLFLCPFFCLVFLFYLTIFSVVTLVWAGLSIYLGGLSLVGINYKQQLSSLFYFLSLSFFPILISLFFLNSYSLPSYSCLLFVLVFALQALSLLPKKSTSLFSMAAIIVIFLPTVPRGVGLSLWKQLQEIYEGLFLGVSLLSLWILLLPFTPRPFLPNDYRIGHHLLRFLKNSLAVALAFYFSQHLGFKHPAWAGLSAFVISQGTLGATILKAQQRIYGTVFGVLIGIPISIFLYYPYPWTRVFAIFLFAYGLLNLSKNYVLTTITVGLSIGALFFILSPSLHSAMAFLPYISERIFETLFGVVVFFIVEFVFYPRSIIGQIHYSSYLFWQGLSLAILEKDSNLFQVHLDKSKLALEDYKKYLEDFRYEPIAILNKKYHYAIKVHHYLEGVSKIIEAKGLFFSEEQNSQKFALILERMSYELMLQKDARLRLLKTLQEEVQYLENEEEMGEIKSMIKRIIKYKISILNSHFSWRKKRFNMK